MREGSALLNVWNPGNIRNRLFKIMTVIILNAWSNGF